jgi:gamma-glutamylputrescine oxidase
VYDLIIIGGGMSGISVAYTFHNQHILLLEKNELLSSATGKNAGYLISGFGEHFCNTAKKWGFARAREIKQIHLSSHQRIRENTNGVEGSGSFTIGTTEKEIQDLRTSFEQMRSLGFRVEWFEQTPTGLRKPAPGILNRDDGIIDSVRFWNELAQQIPYRTNCGVIAVKDEGSSFIVDTTCGEFRAKRVVYCLNAYSGELLPELKQRIIPLRGQMMELELHSQPPCEQPIITEYGEIYWNYTASTLRFGGLEYRMPEAEIGFAISISETLLNLQLDWIQDHLDANVSTTPIKSWCGTMAFTVDGFPFVGQLPGRQKQYVLAGMCGLGHSYALECAAWLYELILNGKNEIPAYFSSDRILNLAEHAGGNWRSLYEAWNH